MKTRARKPSTASSLMSWRSGAGLVFAVLMSGCERTDLQPVRFSPVSEDLFDQGGALTDAWADIDLDGDPDRFVGFNGTPSRLYRNDGIDGFVDIASEVGLTTERSVRTSAWGDFDSDGDPDLLLGYSGEALSLIHI